jgi:ribosome-binding ATPase YchF (GTP1/OBG family)
METNIPKNFIEKFGEQNTLIVSADIENQINELESEERSNYMEMIGLKETGLSMLIQKGYKILDLDTYFTSGPEETRALDNSKKLYSSKSSW